MGQRIVAIDSQTNPASSSASDRQPPKWAASVVSHVSQLNKIGELDGILVAIADAINVKSMTPAMQAELVNNLKASLDVISKKVIYSMYLNK